MTSESPDAVFFLAGLLAGIAFVGLFAPQHTQLAGDITGSERPVVFYKDHSALNQSIAFYSQGEAKGIVCSTNRRDEVQVSRSTFKYVNSTDCRVVEEDLTEEWDDPGFEDINVYERGQELVGNRSD